MNTELYHSLNPAQLAAVQHIDGPLLMLAGPGSGKTRVVTHRIAHMLQSGVAAHNILALTFTNKAADEMRERIQKLAPREPVWIGTFHRFCARLLRKYASQIGLSENYSILDSDDSLKLLKLALNNADVNLELTTPQAVVRGISWAKNQLITAENYTHRAGDPHGALVERMYPVYQERLLAANAVDFDDLLLHVAQLLRENEELRASLDQRYQYVMVDEYQDTNLAQYAIVRALSIDHQNLAVTGDPDQSIYGWRGANLRNILDFEKDFPEVGVVRLEQNYRSTQAILRVAQELIAHNVRRKEKDLYTDNPEGRPVRLVEYPQHYDEARHIASYISEEVRAGRRRPRDFAIFYRVNALSRNFEHVLREQMIPYQIVNGFEFYQRKEIKDVLAYLHLINNPVNDVAFMRVINTPPRGIGKKSIEAVIEHARRYDLCLMEAARERKMIGSLPKRGGTQLGKFVEMIDQLAAIAHRPVEEVLAEVLDQSGYRKQLQAADNEEDSERLANIEELLTAAREFDEKHPELGALEAYLENVSLVADTDAWEAETDKVTLMTLHGAKGLEFPVVFLVAAEEGILPHERSRRDESQYEEERRLMFVGITRAMDELWITRAGYRNFRGSSYPTVPSPFLMELPRAEMQIVEGSGRMRGPGFYDPTMQDEAYERPHPEEFEAPYEEPGFEPDPIPADDEYTQDEPQPKTKTLPALQTAAEMFRELQEQTASYTGHPPELFQPGMNVEHPKYGEGYIIALSGPLPKRKATVRFFNDNEEHTFVLKHSDLQPVEE